MTSSDIPIPACEVFLTPEEVSQRYGLTVRTLATWRFQNGKRIGPPYLKLGASIRYPLSMLLEWEKRNLFQRSDPSGDVGRDR
jgi:hypothetical protein